MRISKLRAGTFFPSLQGWRRRVDQALFVVVMEAYVHGVSPCNVNDLVKSPRADAGISRSEVSRVCGNLDEDRDVAAFRDRPVTDTGYLYVFLKATYFKARVGRRVVSQAVVIAVGVAADGRQEALAFEVGDTGSQPFWTGFLRSLAARGPDGVKLVISQPHTGLPAAIETVLLGARWQRCRMDLMRNVLSNVHKNAGPIATSIVLTILAQPDKLHVHAQFDEVVRMLTRSQPKLAPLLEDAHDDLLPFAPFPCAHWRQIWYTNRLEAVNTEIKRRTEVVGAFHNPAAQLSLAGHVLNEQHDEWDNAERRYFSEHFMTPLDAT